MIDEWRETQEIVLGYIFNNGLVPFGTAISRLMRKYFDGDRLVIWELFVNYNQKTLGIPSDLEQFRKFIRSFPSATEEKLIELEKVRESCMSQANSLDDSAFIWHLGRLGDIYRQIKLGETLDQGSQILVKDGYHKAKSAVLTAMSEIETGGFDLGADGDVLKEANTVIDEVGRARDTRLTDSIDLGFPSLDRHIMGLRGGDIAMYAAWTGAGKTTFCVNQAVDVAFTQKKNVIFVTTETIRQSLRRRIFARITKLPAFRELTPIPSGKLKSGELNDAEKETLLAVRNYLESGEHGILQVVQAPSHATMGWLRGKLLQFESQFPVHFVILDDLRSMTPSVRRRQEFEEITGMMKELKNIARTHANRGVPIVSPHHINRDAYKKVISPEGGGMFDLSGLAGASEVEKRSDIVIGIWYDRETSEHELRFDMLKQRDGRSGDSITVRVQWEYQYMYEVGRDMGGIDE